MWVSLRAMESKANRDLKKKANLLGPNLPSEENEADKSESVE